MRMIVGVLLFVLAGLDAAAQQTPISPSLPNAAQGLEMGRAAILSRPSLDPVAKAFIASGIEITRPVLVIEYDADGTPLKVSLDPASGNAALDEAILTWGRQVKLKPAIAGEPGTGRMPFDLVVAPEKTASQRDANEPPKELQKE